MTEDAPQDIQFAKVSQGILQPAMRRRDQPDFSNGSDSVIHMK
jgi:hypothetical protein